MFASGFSFSFGRIVKKKALLYWKLLCPVFFLFFFSGNCIGDRCHRNSILRLGKSLKSSNGKYKLVLKTYGNLGLRIKDTSLNILYSKMMVIWYFKIKMTMLFRVQSPAINVEVSTKKRKLFFVCYFLVYFFTLKLILWPVR